MKGWEPQKYWRRRERLLAVIRWLHYIRVRDEMLHGEELKKELLIIDKLNRRLFQNKQVNA